MEHIRDQQLADKSFDAKLHGMKMNTPIVEQSWEPEQNTRLTDFAQKRFEEMSKRATEMKGQI